MLQKTLTLIEQSHTIALLLPENPTLDCLIAAEVLAQALAGQSKNVGFLAHIPLSQNLETLKSLSIEPSSTMSPLSNLSSRNLSLTAIGERGRKEYFPALSAPSPLPRDFIISIDTAQSPVAQLKYEKGDNTLDIILSPKEGKIEKEHIAYKAGNILCDCAIILGGEDIDSMEQEDKMPPDFFTRTPLARVSNERTKKDENEADYIDIKKTSLCEMVYSLLSSLSPSSLTQETASLLFTGIINETKNFTHPSTNADVLLAASELMRLGASKKSGILEHTPEYNEKPSLDLLHLCGRAMVRSKIHEDMSLVFSFLTPDDFEKTHEGKDAVHAVLASQKHMLPALSSHVLFWQTAGNEDIHVIAADKKGKFKEPPFIRAEKNSFFALEKTFSSFGEAENYVLQLIAEEL